MKITAGAPCFCEHRQRVLERVAVAVVEGDQHRLLRAAACRACSGRARRRGRRLVAELAQLRELLVELPDRDRRRVVGDVVDLVVHQDAQRPLAVGPEAERGRRLADRPVEGVLDDLLGLLSGHGRSLRPGLAASVNHRGLNSGVRNVDSWPVSGNVDQRLLAHWKQSQQRQRRWPARCSSGPRSRADRFDGWALDLIGEAFTGRAAEDAGALSPGHDEARHRRSTTAEAEGPQPASRTTALRSGGSSLADGAQQAGSES